MQPKTKLRKKQSQQSNEKWTQEQVKIFNRQVFADCEHLAPDKMPYKIGIHKDIYHLIKDKYPNNRTRCRNAVGLYFFRRCRQPDYKQWLKRSRWRWGRHGRRVSRLDERSKNE